MTTRSSKSSQRGATVQAHLLGQVSFTAGWDLQQRLVYESAGRDDGQIDLLLCEHPHSISIGRRGSRSHLNVSQQELQSRKLPVHWVNRGGGCLVHGPGQLAAYAIVPLAWHGYSVGAYLERLQSGVRDTLEELGYQLWPQAGRFGLWGRTGQCVAVAAAVKNWTSYFGAYINVSSDVKQSRLADADPWTGTRVSSLSAERRQPAKMTAVRSGLVRHFSAAFASTRYYIHSGHPWLRSRPPAVPEAPARAG